MKQETGKKSKKLIWLIIGMAALLLAVGAVLFFLMMPGNEQANAPTGPVGGRPDLYWNVDRTKYLGNDESAGLSTREPAEDGLYHIRFAYNGELVEYTFADKRLVNVIDNLDVMGLSLDANGNAIDVIDPSNIATEVAPGFFVVTNKNGLLQVNSSIVMNGMQLPLEMGELAQIYDVRPDAPNPGAFAEVEPMDKVFVYSNDKDEVTHVFIAERQPESDVYWRVGRYYDTTKKETTRVPDENGVYTMVFAKDGKQIELKCADKDLVNAIDSRGGVYNAPKGLVVDADGFIQQEVDPIIALRGKAAGVEYHITEMDGNRITATYLLSGNENGKTFTVEIPEDCPIYNVCVGGSANMIGEPTELQMMDRIICYTDLEGKPILIYMMYRLADSPMYYNITRMYDDTSKQTTRVPDASGYYKFKLAVGGKQVTLKTKDKEIANQIDSKSYFIFGLDVEGDIIKRVYDPAYVSGNDIYGAGGVRFLTGQTGSIMSFVTTFYGGFSPFNLVAKPDVEVYDVTGYPGTKMGEKTTVNVGDTLRFMADYNNNVTHIYVMERYTGKPIYYNYSRMYDTAKQVSTRKPNEEGYYVFEMASGGKEYTGEKALKTKDADVARIIDAQLAPVVALDVKNGIIRAAYPAATSYQYGYKTSNYHWIKSLNDDNTYTTIVRSSGATYTYKLAEDCKVYNVSQIYDKHRGEKIPVSSLRPDDRIQAIATKDDELVREIYVMSRTMASKFYYNLSRKYNSTTMSTTRVPDAEGYYVFDIVAEGEIKQYKTKDKAVATAIDAFNYVPFGMKVSGDIVKLAFPATDIKGVGSVPASNYDVTKLSKTDMTVTRYLPTYANVGDQIELKLASNYKAYDVSAYAEPFGGKVKLALGDRAIYYANMDGEIEWAFIWYKNTHEKGHISYCEHCNKKVYWQPYTGTTYSSNGADNVHLYVTSDRKFAQAVHGKLDMPKSERTEVIIDLNGKTLSTSSYRNFLVYGTLSIVDTVGGGKLMGSTDAGTASGGSIMIGKDGVVNLYSGTITENPKNTTNGYGGAIYLGAGGTFNMYGGTVEGGTATTEGGNIWIGSATFNMTGGTVAGDIAVVSKDAKITIGGKAKITEGAAGGLILTEGAKVSLKKVTDDTKVVVDARGVFTEESDNIDEYLDNFTASSPEFAVVVQGKALAGGRLEYCQHCDKEVYWSKFSGKGAAGHYIVTDDMQMNSQMVVGSCYNHGKEGASCNHSPEVVVDLNGHTVTADGSGTGNSTGRFALVYGKLAIMDSSAEQTGKITTVRKGTNTGGLILANVLSTVDLYGGELTMEDGATAGKGGILFVSYASFNMYGGKITNGTVVSAIKADGSIDGGFGGNIMVNTGGYVNIYDGVIENGEAENGGNLYVMNSAKIHGGQIKNGVAHTRISENFDGETGVITYSYANGLSGNIHIASAGNVTIGTADGNTQAIVTGGVSRCGGSIYNAGTLLIEKNGVVTGGKAVAPREGYASYSGGNIFNEKNLTIKGVVSDGTAWNGGNISDNSAKTTVIDGGKVTGGIATNGTGGNYHTNKTPLLVQNGAEITDGKATPTSGYTGGGNIYSTKASVTIDGSTVSGGESTRYGGNMLISNTDLVLKNGTVIEGGKGTTAGGSICKWNTGDFIIESGATIGKGDVGLGDGGTVYMNNATKDTTAQLSIAGTIQGVTRVSASTGLVNVTVSGDAKTDGLYLPSGYKVTVGELTENAEVKVSATGAFTVANDNVETFKDRFAPVDPAMGIMVDENKQLAMGIIRHCQHCDQDVLWSTFSQAAAAATGHYIVTKETTLTDQITIAAGKDVVIDLNNNNIIAGAGYGRCALIYGKLSIQDSSADGKGKIIATGTASRRGALFQNSGTLNLYSGELTAAEGSMAADRGGLIVNYATVNIYGGKVTNGRVRGYINTEGGTPELRNGVGGNIYVHDTAVLNVYGGEISGGFGQIQDAGALILGGNIYSSGGAINISGGTIFGGTATDGGNIYASGKLTITGGEISGGVAEILEGNNETGNGGNIYCKAQTDIGKEDGSATVTITGGSARSGGSIYSASGTLNVYKGVTVSGGETQIDNGGNIAIYAGTGNIYGKVADGKSLKKRGGNIAVAGGATVNVIGGEITGGEAATDGGNLSTNNGNINLSQGAKVTGGKAARYGGNIYAWNLTANRGTTVADSEVSGGQALQGGNIAHEGTAGAFGKINITNSTISGGKATYTANYTGGGNIFATSCNVTVTGSRVENGEAVKCGGNALISYANLTLGNGTVFNGGVGSQLGPNICKFNTGDMNIQAGATVSGNWVWMDNSKTDAANLNLAGNVACYMEIGGGPINVTVSGDVKTQKLVFNGSSKCKMTVGELTENADIKIKATGVFTVANEKVKDFKKYFSAAEAGQDIVVTANNELSMGTGIARFCQHCNAEALFTEFSQTAAASTGHYIVTGETTLTDQITIAAGKDVVIDLNNNNIIAGAGAGRCALIYGNVSIQDSSADGKGKIIATGTASRRGGLFQVMGSSSLTLYSGELTAAEGSMASDRGGLIVNYGTVNINGGKVTNGRVKGYIATNSETNQPEPRNGVGGNIYVDVYAKLNVSGGEISGGYGEIQGEGTTILGGNIYSCGGAVNITGGKVIGGKANKGGNIYVSSANATYAGTLTIANAEITNGEAVEGGNIYTTGNSTKYNVVTITDSTISGGKATNTASYTGGGNIFATLSTVTVNGSRVEGGEAGTSGGNALITYANLILGDGTTFDGGTLTATSGTKLGPNICKFNTGELTVQPGATVSGNWVWVNNAQSTAANVNLAGNVNCYMEIGSGKVNATVSGDVKVQKLDLNASSTCKLTLGELTSNASITISVRNTSAVFTNESPKAADYVGYFHASDTTKKVVAENNTLKLVAK